ncbi:ImmA/IrrE family metallo-endopeptidase [Allorhizocola rhizosphaerae]|uniref:ImmA/IrrE family metallo-endopeptidase n=1 Tax=Allorhizocola rhizosphaerae TaxID=1872709 RepID=UPI0013C33E7A|nr:ImmA/IrrE family metallo-endopeptidase [Allorhizocola rhizosphaerae]
MNRKIEAECLEALEGLHIPDPWSADAFLAWLAEARRRPIIVVPWKVVGGITGCWVERETADFLVVDEKATPLHRSHVVCHEAAHMWLGHQGHAAAELSAQAGLPHHYSSEQEQAAETLAALILERAALPSPSRVPDDVRRVMDTLYRGVTVDSLADPRGGAAGRRRRWFRFTV